MFSCKDPATGLLSEDPQEINCAYVIYFLDSDAIVILEVGEKKTQKTSQATIELCQKRLKNYEQAKRQRNEGDNTKR